MFAYCQNNPVVRSDYSGKSYALILGINLNLFGRGLVFSVNLVSTPEDVGVQYSYYLGDLTETPDNNNQTIGFDVGPYIGAQYTEATNMSELEGPFKATGGDLFLGGDVLTTEDGHYVGWQMGASFYSANMHSITTQTKTIFSIPCWDVGKWVRERIMRRAERGSGACAVVRKIHKK